MAKRHVTLRLDLEPGEARHACARAVRELGWDLTGEDGQGVRAAEDPAHLHCHCPPASAEITVAAAGTGTSVDLCVKVPAWGIVSSRQVRDRTDLLARRIVATASRESDRSP